MEGFLFMERHRFNPIYPGSIACASVAHFSLVELALGVGRAIVQEVTPDDILNAAFAEKISDSISGCQWTRTLRNIVEKRFRLRIYGVFESTCLPTGHGL